MFAEKLKMSDGVAIRLESIERAQFQLDHSPYETDISAQCHHTVTKDVTASYALATPPKFLGEAPQAALVPAGMRVEKCVHCHEVFIQSTSNENESSSPE